MLPSAALRICVNNCSTHLVNNVSELNICDNQEHYTQAQYIIRVWLMVPTIVFGLSTHAVNIRIFAMLEMRKSLVNWLILSLCISDVSILVCSFLMFSMPALLELLTSTLAFYNFCALAMRWTYPLATIAQTINIYLTITLSLHRYLGVCHPLRAKSLIDRESVLVSLSSVMVFCALFNATRFMEMTVTPCWSRDHHTQGLMLAQTNLTHNMVYFVLYRVLAYTFFMFLLPFSLLIVINCLIIVSLWQSTRTRRILTNYKKTSVAIFQNIRRSIRLSRPQRAASQTKTKKHDLSTIQEQSHSGSDALMAAPTPTSPSNNNTLSPLSNYPEHKLKSRTSLAMIRSESQSITSASEDQPATSIVIQAHPSSVDTELNRGTLRRLRRLHSSCRRGLRTFQQHSLERNITLIMVALICVFLACNLLPCVSNIADILMHYQLEPDMHGRAVVHPRSPAFTLLVEVGNLTVALNSATSFFIYYALGSKYRSLLFGLFTNVPRAPSSSQHHASASKTRHNAPANQHTASTFSTNQHTASTLSTNQHTASTLSTNQHTASTLSTNQHTASTLSTNQHTASTLSTNQHTASTLSTNQHTASTLSTNQHTASTLSTNQHTASTLSTNQHTASTLSTNQHTASTLSTNQHTASTLPTNQHTASTLPTNQHTASTLPANQHSLNTTNQRSAQNNKVVMVKNANSADQYSIELTVQRP